MPGLSQLGSLSVAPPQSSVATGGGNGLSSNNWACPPLSNRIPESYSYDFSQFGP
jgi:hypothetical protein